MSQPTKSFYAKFRMDNGPLKIWDAFIISENKDRVDHWKGDEHPQSDAAVSAEPAPRNEFESLAASFQNSINIFQNTVPFIMRMLPVLLQLMDDRSVREFTRKRGVCLEKGEFETYSLSIEYLGELTRRIERGTSIRAGVASLPNMFLVGLVSAYDKFLSDLIRVIFMERPELLSSSERNLSFKDLIEIGSVEAARERIIDKEIETVIRKSHSEQISWLESKLNMPLTKDLDIWPDFIEICERRNLFTHTGGVISEQYLKICKDHGCSLEDKNIGETIVISARYYEHAVAVVLEFGMKLVQVVWRKLLPEDIKRAANTLNHFSYGLITKRKYKLAAKMLRFGLYEMKKHGTEAIRKMMVVNYANAEKLGGNIELSSQILDGEDWSASTDSYRICVAPVKDEIETVISLMPRVIETSTMKIENFREWPVFETVRSDPRFVEAFERSFGQRLLAEREATKPREREIATDIDSDPADDTSDSVPNESTLH